jgi:hypothetical protein
MQSFSAKISRIGINPYVLLPATVLNEIVKQANKSKGAIPVCGEVNGHGFTQTLVRYSGKWRLYLNGPMRKGAKADVGDRVDVKIEFDPRPRIIEMHPRLKDALDKNKGAGAAFSALSPSRQKEIVRYIGHLKTEESIKRNVKKAISFLSGKERFVGRDKP